MITHGGKRLGAGRKFGSKGKKTLEKEAALELYRQRAFKKIHSFIEAQFKEAKGVTVMFQRDKATGKFVEVKDPDEIEKILAGNGIAGADYHYITLKDPNVRALSSIFDRIFGKPKRAMEVSTVKSKVVIMEAIHKAYGKNKKSLLND